MRAYKSGVLALVMFMLHAMPARAQEAGTTEVTPYVGFGTAGAAPVGVAVTFPVTSRLSVEMDTAYRRGEGHFNAMSTNASLMWFLPRAGRTTSYVVGGIGLAQYGAPVFSQKGGAPIGTARFLAMTVNAGGGLKVPVSEKMDLRSDARWFKSFGRQGSEQFRVANGLSIHMGK